MSSCPAFLVGTSFEISWWFLLPNAPQSPLAWTGEDIGDCTWGYTGWGTTSKLLLLWESKEVVGSTWPCVKTWQSNGRMCIYTEESYHTVVTNAFPAGGSVDTGLLVLFDNSVCHGVIWYRDSLNLSCTIQVCIQGNFKNMTSSLLVRYVILYKCIFLVV